MDAKADANNKKIYQEGLQETKEYLKTCHKQELEKIIEETGLSPQKAKIVLSKYIQEHNRLFIACEVNCAETKVSTKFTQALRKIKKYLEFMGLIG